MSGSINASTLSNCYNISLSQNSLFDSSEFNQEVGAKLEAS